MFVEIHADYDMLTPEVCDTFGLHCVYLIRAKQPKTA